MLTQNELHVRTDTEHTDKWRRGFHSRPVPASLRARFRVNRERTEERERTQRKPFWDTWHGVRPGVAYAILVLTAVLALFVWEFAAYVIKDFKHSRPSEVWFFLTQSRYVESDLLRLELTTFRGAVGILIAFIIAYPLGAMIPVLGKITYLAKGLILAALWFPKLPIILFVKETIGYVPESVYVIGLWTACTTMLAFGFHQSFNLCEDKSDLIEAARMDGANRWQLYTRIVLPLLRDNHIDNLCILAPRVWAGVTFAEAIILASVIGVGERMVNVAHPNTFGHFYAMCVYLVFLEIATYLAIVWSPKVYRFVRRTRRS